jgi:heme-degrading monooxygenase HmoA
MAFVFIAIHHPKPGHRDDVRRSMERTGDRLSSAPGLLQVGTLTETDGNAMIGFSIWESREAFEETLKALGRFSQAGSQDRLRDEWEERPADEIFAEGNLLAGTSASQAEPGV